MADTKICPYCGEEILAVAKKCKHCGEWLTDDSKDKVLSQITNNSGAHTSLNTEVSSIGNDSSQKPLGVNLAAITPSNRNKWIIFLCVLGIIIIGVLILVGTSLSDSKTVISEEPIEDVPIVENPYVQSQTDEVDFSDNWELKYFKDSFGEDDKSNPYIQKEFSTDSESIKMLFSKNGFAIFGEYFPSLVEELTIKDENGNITVVPCMENAPEHALMAADVDGYKTLVELLDNGNDFTLRLKVWGFGNEYHYEAYKVSGWSGQGIKKAIQKNLAN